VNQAAIDIGSNSILLLIVDADGQVLEESVRIVGLGKGLGDRGLFQPKQMEAAMNAMMEFAQRVRAFGIPTWMVQVVATSAARRAMNAQAFTQRIREKTGFRVQIISGEDEARLTWAGARGGLNLPNGPTVVIDLGGGSTEFAMGDEDQLHMRVSKELGAVRLTEAFFGTAPRRYRPHDMARLRDHIHAELASLQWPTIPRTLIAVAGTATTLAAMERGLTVWDRDIVHGMKLRRAAIRKWIDKLLSSTPSERKEWASVSPARADYILAGAMVLEEACTVSHRDSMVISDGGVRHGLLMTAELGN